MDRIPLILKIESLVFLVSAAWVYASIGASWWWFFGLLLVPDICMVGYMKNSTVGSWVYNLGHTYTVPCLLLALPFFTPLSIPIIIPLVWFAHISMDRFLGFGLKYTTGFKDTHLGRIGG